MSTLRKMAVDYIARVRGGTGSEALMDCLFEEPDICRKRVSLFLCVITRYGRTLCVKVTSGWGQGLFFDC